MLECKITFFRGTCNNATPAKMITIETESIREAIEFAEEKMKSDYSSYVIHERLMSPRNIK